MNRRRVKFFVICLLAFSVKLQVSAQTVRFTQSNRWFVITQDSLVRMEQRLVGLQLQYGLIGNSLFEKHEGGHGHSLYAVALAPDSLTMDTIRWTPMAMINLRTLDDTLDFTVLLLPDSSSLEFKKHVLETLAAFSWVQDISLVEGDTLMNLAGDLVLEKYLLPLPCNHWPIEVNYYGPEDVTLIIDDDVANGLTLLDVLKFLNERKIHFESYHGAHCFERMNRIKLQIFSRNLEISVMTDFVESLTDTKTKLEVDFVE